MYLELHILQNFAPNCLNRDDTNSPKDCTFGGFRRARISSQCLKRAIRTFVREQEILPSADLAYRTKRVIRQVAEQLVREHGRDEADALSKTAAALNSQGLTADEKNETQYLLFLGEREIAKLVAVVQTHWDDIEALPEKPADEESNSKKKKKTSKKSDAPKEVKDAVLALLDGGKAADLALFGRMLADLPAKNIDAASQVAHAISTNAISMEMDYFTAVDDLKNRSAENEDAGAGMLGTVEFNSACYYRYANLHLPQLFENLGGDADLATKTVKAFIKASTLAIPTGKQNSFAAHNPPSFVFAVVRNDSPWSLANAFVKPINPRYDRSGNDIIKLSVVQLDRHWQTLCAAYGDQGILSKAVLVLHDSLTEDEPSPQQTAGIPLKHLQGDVVESLAKLIEKTLSKLNFESARGGAR